MLSTETNIRTYRQTTGESKTLRVCEAPGIGIYHQFITGECEKAESVYFQSGGPTTHRVHFVMVADLSNAAR